MLIFRYRANRELSIWSDLLIQVVHSIHCYLHRIHVIEQPGFLLPLSCKKYLHYYDGNFFAWFNTATVVKVLQVKLGKILYRNGIALKEVAFINFFINELPNDPI